jgi:ferrochelatase
MDMLNTSPTGILLINLGTPIAPTVKSVRLFLKEFLMDKYVIDIPFLFRWFLVNCLILPKRPSLTAELYQQIWTDSGSPMLVHNLNLREKLSQSLGNGYEVALGMRYGQPGILHAVDELLAKGCQKICIFPLFPQYASATTESVLAKSVEILKKNKKIIQIEMVENFYDHPAFIEAWRQVISAHQPGFAPELWLFSYHGLPLRQLQHQGCEIKKCLQNLKHCSPQKTQISCYRHHCLQTTSLIAEALGLEEQQYRISFQSRLGRLPWLPPYTDQLLPQLRAQGIERLAVVCPSFVTDCLETLEEIGIRAKSQWLGLGGTHFSLISSLNVHSAWIQGLHQIVIGV